MLCDQIRLFSFSSVVLRKLESNWCSIALAATWGGWQVPLRGPPCYGIAWNVNQKCGCITRATTTTRAGCVQRGLGSGTPDARRGIRDAIEYDPRPSMLQLNTEELISNKTSVIEHVAYKNKALIFFPQETHCQTHLPAQMQKSLWFLPSHKMGQSWDGSTALPRFFTSGWNVHWSISLLNIPSLCGCV